MNRAYTERRTRGEDAAPPASADGARTVALFVALAVVACGDGRSGGHDYGGAYGARAEPTARDCAQPAEGCACASNQPPVACTPDSAAAAPDFCLEGTRRCVQGRFGGCEDVRRFAAAEPVELAALVDLDARHARCSDCDPTCFRVNDNFDPADGALAGAFATGVQYHSSGAGLMLTPNAALIPTGPPPAGLPAGTLYLQIPEGLSASASHATRVRPAQSDVYLLLDRSSSMATATLWLHDAFDTGTFLPAGTACASGDDALLGQGLAGALRCAIANTELGLGMFRDIPFEPYASDQSLPADERALDARREIAFRNQAAQTADLASVRAAFATLGGFESSGDPDVAGSQIAALHSLATGAGLDPGLDRSSVPAAQDCDGERFGYACFRADSDPLVVLVTDAPMHNGPEPGSYPYDYDPAQLSTLIGTAPGATAVPAGHDAWSSAYAIAGDAASTLAVYEGTTLGLGTSVPASAVSCGANGSAPNAVFRFHVEAPGAPVPVALSTEGSSFATALAVLTDEVSGVEGSGSSNDNELFTTAHAFGDVTRRHVLVQGDTENPSDPADMGADYQGSLFGAACGGNTLAPDAVFSFDVSPSAPPADVQVLLGMGSDHAVLSVYEAGVGPLPRWPARTTALTVSSDEAAYPANVYEIPSGAGNEYVTVRGDSAALAADFDASVLGDAACAPDSASRDDVLRIHVDGTRTLRFDTEGSSFDTVLSLHDAPPLSILGLGSPSGGVVACDDNGVAGTTASVIERTLSEGDYYLVVKGKRASDQGPYLLTVRDVGAVATSEIGCDASAGTGDQALVRFTAQPGRSYYALVKGQAPLDKGHYTLQVRDDSGLASLRLGCDASSGPGGSSRLSVPLATGDYYAVIKGRSASEAGAYRLTVGGATPTTATFVPPSYAQTVDALAARGMRVSTVLACSGGDACADATAQAEALAAETSGVVRSAASAADVPAEVVRAVQLSEALDTVRGELLFAPDDNPGFTFPSVVGLADPNNLCSAGSDPASFRDCAPGATPSFRVSLTHPALAPVPPPMSAPAYAFTLRITGERDGEPLLQEDVPVLVAPTGTAPPGSYDRGSYHQDFGGLACTNATQRPSWDELTVDADVRPDTRVDVFACTANDEEGLDTCDDGAESSGYRRVVTISAGSGTGTPCTEETQASDCPSGYCSPYTGVCNELEGATCTSDDDCPGTVAGRCRAGASAAELGNTCRLDDLTASPTSVLGEHNHRPFMRVRLELESGGDGSRTPAVFFWEALYRCRNVE